MSSQAARDEVEDIATEEVRAALDDLALRTVARCCSAVTLQRAMAAALMRHAGNALAQLADHEEAFHTHTRLARRHHQKMSHVPGARRR